MADANRPVRFELHILPLMRIIDHDNMSPQGIDLWSYDSVRTNADKILDRISPDLSGGMPPLKYGGPWPLEWVALFKRWKDEGFQRLELGAADAPGYTITLNGSTVSVQAQGKAPTSGYRSWLHASVTEQKSREYILYLEPPTPVSSLSPTVFRVRANFPLPAGMTSIVITDANGTQTVPIPTPPPPMP